MGLEGKQGTQVGGEGNEPQLISDVYVSFFPLSARPRGYLYAEDRYYR